MEGIVLKETFLRDYDRKYTLILGIEKDMANAMKLENNYLSLLPLKNVVMLPKSIIPIIVGRPASIKAVEFALKHDREIFITSQKEQSVENPTEKDIFKMGTKSTILQVMRMPNGSLKILAEGICRAKILKVEKNKGFKNIYYHELPTTGIENQVELEAIWRQLKMLYSSYTKLNEKAPIELVGMVKNADDMDYITDTIAIHINLTFQDRQNILETVNLQERMLKICGFLQKEIEILQTEQKIKGRIQTQVEKNQREYYLNEQMKAIQKELGREDHASEINDLRNKGAKLGLPKEAQEKLNKELQRLEQMPPLSSEAVVSRHYVDWLTSIPWNKESTDDISIDEAETILEKEHFGLKKPKERIIEFLAAKKFSKSLNKAPIICLVGPPGVGKTSLAQSVANSLGRNFVRISLGGIRDEAEIRGHRRTYIGALPGKIIQAMKKAKTINPVILLDEIDKMSQDIHGDPASALLEVLDPEQNKTFVDHFLDLNYDLSKVMFVTTANMIETIPYPLFDRMEIISLSGYTEDEKIEIAKKFLIPKNLKEHGLKASQFKISKKILLSLVSKYTKEAGVRQLERVITKVMRKTIQNLLKTPKKKTFTVTETHIKEWLGNPKFRKTSLNTENKIGLSTGLAWTEIGGDVLEIETSCLKGKGSVTLTGQLGEVMQESAQAALSYIRSRAPQLGLKPTFNNSKDIHIHLPEGATPKDGPSAGITMCAALISGLTEKPMLPSIAMTGEITLQGRVLAIGGLKEKLLAAKQHNIKKVILPHENYDEAQEIIKDTKLGKMELTFVKNMDEVIDASFKKGTFKPKKTKSRATKNA